MVKWSPSNLFSSTLGGLPDFVKFTLAAHLPLSVFYGTLPAKVALKKAHFGKGPRLECAPSHFACQSEFAKPPCDITA